MMKTPDEFAAFAGSFYQGSREEAKSTEEWIDGRVNLLSPASRKIVTAFIASQLNDDAAANSLLNAWLSADAAYGPNSSDARNFFRLLLDRL